MIQLEAVTKIYRMGRNIEVPALRGIDLEIPRGSFLAIMGASGSGKSTLLNIIGCLDTPTQGVYRLDGLRVDQLTDNQLAALRNRYFGFVFQQFNLIPSLNALENVLVPATYSDLWSGTARRRAMELLERVGLARFWRHRPAELSGGQQQRVAIARALMNRPRVLLADEPTGNLDSDSGAEVMNLLEELWKDEGLTILVVTHDQEVAARARRIVRMRDGRIIADEVKADAGRSAAR